MSNSAAKILGIFKGCSFLVNLQQCPGWQRCSKDLQLEGPAEVRQRKPEIRIGYALFGFGEES